MRSESKQYHYRKHPWYQKRSKRGSRPNHSLILRQKATLTLHLYAPVCSGEKPIALVFLVALWGRGGWTSVGANSSAPLGVGLHNLCLGFAPQNNVHFGPASAEVGHASPCSAPQMQLVNESRFWGRLFQRQQPWPQKLNKMHARKFTFYSKAKLENEIRINHAPSMRHAATLRNSSNTSDSSRPLSAVGGTTFKDQTPWWGAGGISWNCHDVRFLRYQQQKKYHCDQGGHKWSILLHLLVLKSTFVDPRRNEVSTN